MEHTPLRLTNHPSFSDVATMDSAWLMAKSKTNKKQTTNAVMRT